MKTIVDLILRMALENRVVRPGLYRRAISASASATVCRWHAQLLPPRGRLARFDSACGHSGLVGGYERGLVDLARRAAETEVQDFSRSSGNEELQGA
jgi:hypothetical protein